MNRAFMLRVVFGIALLVLALFVLLSVATYDPHDPPASMANYPLRQVPANYCGTVGAYIAAGLRYMLGSTAYLLVLLLAFGGAVVVLRGMARERWINLAGAALFMLSCATLADMLAGGEPSATLSGPGGIVGHLINHHLLLYCGWGGYLVILAVILLSGLVATDLLPVIWARAAFARLRGWRAKASQEAEAETARITRRQRLLELEGKLKESQRPKKAEAEKSKIEPPAPPAPEPKPPEEKKSVALEPAESPPKPPPAAKPPSEEKAEEFSLPPIDLLDEVPPATHGLSDEMVREKAAILERTLLEFGVDAEVVEVQRGPVVTQYEIELSPGIKVGKIVALADGLARALKAVNVRIVAPIPGKSTVGVEVPNPKREIVRLRGLLESETFDRKRMAIPLLLGKDSSGVPLVADLTQMPHLLIAGCTGSGKSVCINSIILSVLMLQKPEDLRMILVDPKMVELGAYENIPHLMSPVLTDMKKAAAVLEWACGKMDERYALLHSVGARNITAYNRLGLKGIRERLGVDGEDVNLDDVPTHLPYILIIIDEFADLMMVASKEVESSITRLAQKSRAVGIHLVMATQRPSVDVITGLIKANIPCRIAFQVSAKVDSRTILDRNGAEKLLGEGDMLFLPPGTSKLIRAQGTFTSDEEIRRVVGFLSKRKNARQFDPELTAARAAMERAPQERDELFEEAVRIVLESQRGSVSLLQRRLEVGYSRAARLIDMMAEAGIVGEYKGSQAREVLMTLEEWEAKHKKNNAPSPAE